MFTDDTHLPKEFIESAEREYREVMMGQDSMSPGVPEGANNITQNPDFANRRGEVARAKGMETSSSLIMNDF